MSKHYDLQPGETVEDSAMTAGPCTSWPLWLRKLVAPTLRRLNPRYSFCGRCGVPWSHIAGHFTRYKPAYRCFPLCEPCWAALKPQQRLPHYRELWERWEDGGHNDVEWEDLRVAVFRDAP